MKSMKVTIANNGAVHYWMDIRKGGHGVALLEDLMTRHRHIARRGGVPDPYVDQIDLTLREWMGVVNTIVRVLPKRFFPALYVYFHDVDPADYVKSWRDRHIFDYVRIELSIQNYDDPFDRMHIYTGQATQDEINAHRWPQTMLLDAIKRLNNYIDWRQDLLIDKIRNFTDARATYNVDIHIPHVITFNGIRDLDREILNHNCMVDMGNRLVLKPEPWDYCEPFDYKELVKDTEKLIKEIQQDQDTEKKNGEA